MHAINIILDFRFITIDFNFINKPICSLSFFPPRHKKFLDTENHSVKLFSFFKPLFCPVCTEYSIL